MGTQHDPASRMTLYPLLDSKYDSLFKTIVTAQWNVKSDGNVESPSGFFALVEIPLSFSERFEMMRAVEDAIDAESAFLLGNMDGGWYLTQEDNNGIIYVYQMETELQAQRFYKDLERTYADWENEADV